MQVLLFPKPQPNISMMSGFLSPGGCIFIDSSIPKTLQGTTRKIMGYFLEKYCWRYENQKMKNAELSCTYCFAFGNCCFFIFDRLLLHLQILLLELWFGIFGLRSWVWRTEIPETRETVCPARKPWLLRNCIRTLWVNLINFSL